MYDPIIHGHLILIRESIILVEKRFGSIKTADDFVSSDSGVLILDGITMRLQVIGESLKKINKINPELLTQYREIQWDHIMRLRDNMFEIGSEGFHGLRRGFEHCGICHLLIASDEASQCFGDGKYDLKW